MVGKSPARTTWVVRLQHKFGRDYLARQSGPVRRMAILAAVLAVHVVLAFGFLSWRSNGRALEMLIPVKIVADVPAHRAK